MYRRKSPGLLRVKARSGLDSGGRGSRAPVRGPGAFCLPDTESRP